MKKILAMLLVLTMLLALVACAAPAAQAPAAEAPVAEAPAEEAAPTDAAPAADALYPAETVKIGFVNYDTTAEQVLAIQKYFEYLQTGFNFEVIWSESLDSAEAEFAFIEQCAAAGCKAVIGYYNEGKSESVKLANDLGMYYWGGAINSDIYEPVKNEEMYLGGYVSGEGDKSENYLAGYGIGKALADAGCKNIIVMSGGKDFGVEFFVERYTGIMDAVKEFGMNVVYEVPGWPGTEEFAAHQTAALETDADGLAGTLTCLMWMQPMQNAGKMGQIKIAGIETVSADLAGLMQGGIYVGTFSEITDVFGMAIPMILNAVEGYGAQQRNADGTAARVGVKNWSSRTRTTWPTLPRSRAVRAIGCSASTTSRPCWRPSIPMCRPSPSRRCTPPSPRTRFTRVTAIKPHVSTFLCGAGVSRPPRALTSTISEETA